MLRRRPIAEFGLAAMVLVPWAVSALVLAQEPGQQLPDTGIGLASILIAFFVVSRQRRVRLTADALVADWGFGRRYRAAWSDIADIRTVTRLGTQSVQVIRFDGTKFFLPAPSGTFRRTHVDEGLREITAWWKAHSQPDIVPPPVEFLAPPTRSERLWAAAACASCYVSVPIGPLIVLRLRGRSSPFVMRHAKAAINYGLSSCLYLAIVLGLLALTNSPPVVLVLVLLGMFMMVMPWISAARAVGGMAPAWLIAIRLVR